MYFMVFVTPSSLIEFYNNMPFRLTNAPRIFEMTKNDILEHLLFVKIYPDDILIFILENWNFYIFKESL